jgi:hypothetical protein
MKWLKTYKIFESKEDIARFKIIQTVKDILLPISDLDYTIGVTESPLYHQDFNTDSLIGYQLIIRVVSWGDQSLLITDDIKQDFITMKDYLESEGYNSIEVLYHLATPGSISSRDINPAKLARRKEFDDFMKYEPWQKVKIRNLLFVAKKIE